jgi:type II secretory pathway component PulF
MSAYRYVALDREGQEVSGNIDADDRKGASQKLRQKGLYVVDLDDANTSSTASLAKKSDVFLALRMLKPIGTTNKVFYFKQLSLMLRSGMSLTDGLNTMMRLLDHPKMAAVVGDILHRVRAGDSFSNATAAVGIFPLMAEHMIRSAEASGELDVVMERIGDHMERKAKLQRDIMTTALYPMVVIFLGVGMFIFLVTGVIPKFAKYFESNGKALPEMTQNLLNLSNFVGQYWIFLVACLVFFVMTIILFYKSARGRLKIDQALLSVPVIGSVITFGAMSQLTWSLSMLLRSGLTVVESLEISAKLIANRSISADLTRARDHIIRGKDISTSLIANGITPLVQQLAGIGEKSGNLDQVMEEAGNYYEEALQIKSKVLGSLIEPAAILLIGGMVAYVYIAFFKAIFAISSV